MLYMSAPTTVRLIGSGAPARARYRTRHPKVIPGRAVINSSKPDRLLGPLMDSVEMMRVLSR